MECSHCSFLNHSELRVCEICGNSLLGHIKRKKCEEMCMESGKSMEKTNDNECGDFNSVAATYGIVPMLRNLLLGQRAKFALCSACPHITQRGFEGAQWACGYRNIQMMCMALIQRPEFKSRLFSGSGEIPDVYGIQSWIERAWQAGFDEAGCEELGGKLLGTETWIGATECTALLRFFGLRAHIVEFNIGHQNLKRKKATSIYRCPNPQGSLRFQSVEEIRGFGRSTSTSAPSSSLSSSSSVSASFDDDTTHIGERVGFQRRSPPSRRYQDAKYSAQEEIASTNTAPTEVPIGQRMANWVRKYFRKFGSNNSVSIDRGVFIPPLYCQHDGHSRTIVGYSEAALNPKRSHALTSSHPETHLIVFDPACNGKLLKENLEANNGRWQRQVKRGAHTMTQSAYQIVYVSPGHMTAEEVELGRYLQSVEDTEDIRLYIT